MADLEPDEDPSESRNYVTALARGLSVIKAFNGQSPQMTLSDVARVANLPRATVRRCLLTLQALQLLLRQLQTSPAQCPWNHVVEWYP